MRRLCIWLAVGVASLAVGVTSDHLDKLPQLSGSLEDSVFALTALPALPVLPRGYLPPLPAPIGGDGGVCPPGETQTLTETEFVTDTVTRNDVSTYVTYKTIHEEVPSYVVRTILSTVLTTVPVNVVTTLRDTEVIFSTQVETEHLPGPTTTVTEFSRAFQTELERQQVTSTLFSTVVSTDFRVETVFRTETDLETLYYPSVVRRQVTKTVQKVDTTVTSQNFIQQTQTVTSQYPTVTATQHEVDFETVTETQTVSSPSVTVTDFVALPRTVVSTVTENAPAPQVNTRFVTRAFSSFITVTVNVNGNAVVDLTTTITEQLERTLFVPHQVTVTSSRVFTSTVAPIQVTEVIPSFGSFVTAVPSGPGLHFGDVIPSPLTVSTVYETRAVPQVTTRVVEVKQPCAEGYNYQAPGQRLFF